MIWEILIIAGIGFVVLWLLFSLAMVIIAFIGPPDRYDIDLDDRKESREIGNVYATNKSKKLRRAARRFGR